MQASERSSKRLCTPIGPSRSARDSEVKMRSPKKHGMPALPVLNPSAVSANARLHQQSQAEILGLILILTGTVSVPADMRKAQNL